MITSGRREISVGDRVFARPMPWLLTEALVADAAQLLAPEIPHDVVLVGIARGGVHVATELGRHGSHAVAIVHARHNPDDATHLPASGVVHVDVPKGVAILRQPLALIDDICGSAATIASVASALRARGCRMWGSATLCTNVGRRGTPRLTAWLVDDWVVFPWEKPLSGKELPPPTVIRGSVAHDPALSTVG